jgi:hypothetical protein
MAAPVLPRHGRIVSGRLDRLVARSAGTAVGGVRPRPAARFETGRPTGSAGSAAADGVRDAWPDADDPTDVEGSFWSPVNPERNGRPEPVRPARPTGPPRPNESVDDAQQTVSSPQPAPERRTRDATGHTAGRSPLTAAEQHPPFGSHSGGIAETNLTPTTFAAARVIEPGAVPPPTRHQTSNSSTSALTEEAGPPRRTSPAAGRSRGSGPPAATGTAIQQQDSPPSAWPMPAEQGLHQDPLADRARAQRSVPAGPAPDDTQPSRPLLVVGTTPDLTGSVRTSATSVIEVTIGRLDVRAEVAARRPAPRPAQQTEHGEQLRTYLRSRARRELP